ncbi:Uncharacterized protein Fot_07142 [Forsythia ovata]|uniref:Uncharacterized protein n=1 Tax=Forsythia ovata TaxID=205694 RepID=A0ABD1WXV2_9LAMI
MQFQSVDLSWRSGEKGVAYDGQTRLWINKAMTRTMECNMMQEMMEHSRHKQPKGDLGNIPNGPEVVLSPVVRLRSDWVVIDASSSANQDMPLHLKRVDSELVE